MPVRNHHWYNLNSTRKYPLDDQATAISDAGEVLPQELLCDARLRFPATLGNYMFISSASSTSTLVTLTFLVAHRVDSDVSLVGDKLGDFQPAAAISIPQADIVPYRMYPVSGLVDGVGGWVAFGTNTADILYSGKFSQPEQTMLAPQAARNYPVLPVTSIGKPGRSSVLTGLVQLLGDGQIEVVADTRTIDDQEQEVLIVRVRDADNANSDLLSQLTGPCGGRPESHTCDRRAVERLNNLEPDCNGNIDIVFSGQCLDVYPLKVGGTIQGGLVLDLCVGLADACVNEERLPTTDGTLPNDYVDICATPQSSSLSLSSVVPSSLSSSSSGVSSACLDSLPVQISFDAGTAPDFYVKTGTFSFAATDSPKEIGGLDNISSLSISYSSSASSLSCPSSSFSSDPCPPINYIHRWVYRYAVGYVRVAYYAVDKTTRNVSVWDNCAMGTCVPFTIDTHIFVPSQATLGNGGIILNWRRNGSGQDLFYLVELDMTTGSVAFRRFNGFTFTDPPMLSASLGLLYDNWYALRVVVQPPTGLSVEDGSAAGNAKISASVWDVFTETSLVSDLTLNVSNGTFGAYTGLHGVGSRRSTAYFSFWNAYDSVYGGSIFG